MKPKLVCFDLGGVLIRICRSWEEGCRAAGVTYRGELRGGPDIEAGNLTHQRGEIDCDTFTRWCAQRAAGAYSPDEIARVHVAWTLGAYEGVERLIKDIHAAGMKTAVLSNTCEGHWKVLMPLPVLQAIPIRLASQEIRACKPDRRAYEEVERATGSHGDEIVYFDDLSANIAGAAALGWSAHLIDHARDTAAQMRAVLAPALSRIMHEANRPADDPDA